VPVNGLQMYYELHGTGVAERAVRLVPMIEECLDAPMPEGG